MEAWEGEKKPNAELLQHLRERRIARKIEMKKKRELEDVEEDAAPAKRIKTDMKKTQSSTTVGEEEEQHTIIDLSSNKTTCDFQPVAVSLGSGWKVGVGTVSFQAGGTQGSYEAFTISKEGKDKKPLSLNLPIRLLPTLVQVVSRFKKARDCRQLPSLNDLRTLGETGRDLNLSHCTGSEIPKIEFKIDDLFFVKGETLDWGKGSYDALSFIRRPKDCVEVKSGGVKNTTAKKEFSLSIPSKFFDVLFLAVQYLADRKQSAK